MWVCVFVSVCMDVCVGGYGCVGVSVSVCVCVMPSCYVRCEGWERI